MTQAAAACKACEDARTRVCAGMYHTWCDGCMARAVSRSLAAFHALHPQGLRDQGPLRELIAQMFPEAKRQQARRDVWEWWQVDHPGPEQAPQQEAPKA